MKKYAKIKDSKIKWIEKIPEHWEISRISQKFHYQKNHVNPDEIKNEQVFLYSIPYVQKYGKGEVVEGKSIESGKFEISGKEILISKLNPRKSTVILTQKNKLRIVCSTEFLPLVPIDIEPKFGFYLLSSYEIKEFLSSYVQSVTKSHQRISPEILMQKKYIFPTKLEQKKISQFLENKISKIDSKISKNKKLIELLKEKIQVTINQSVTKGLDPTLPIKNSNIKRIGDFPVDWSINKIKFVANVKGRIGWQGLRSDEFTDSGPYLITGTDFKEGKINWKSCHHVENWRYAQDPHIQIKEKDILITKDGTIGKIAYVDNVPDKTTLNTGVLVVRPINEKLEPTYLFWLLKSNQFVNFIEMIKSGSTVQHLYQETFENFQFTLPKTLDEQKQITKFLDKRISKINDVLYLIICQIKKLEELKQSLTSSAVTGKIDVREAVA